MSSKVFIRVLAALSLAFVIIVQPVAADPNVPPSVPLEGGPSEYPHTPIVLPPARSMSLQSLSALPPEIISDPVLDMKVLLIQNRNTAQGVNDMIHGYLDILGIPYDVVDTADRVDESDILISPADLSSGNHGHYYAIFIACYVSWYDYPGIAAGLLPSEKSALIAYEQNFGVRRVTWYVYPYASDYGLDFVSTPDPNEPFTMTLTTAGQEVFPYLRPDATLYITGTFRSHATPAAGADVTPLIVDQLGYTVLSIFRTDDGREQMAMTNDAYYPAWMPAHLHARVLPYGIINWATKGVFLGERHLYFVPQPDDVFSYGDRWDPVNNEYIWGDADTGYRMGPEDLDNLLDWMHTVTTTVDNAAGFRIEMPFNGDGAAEEMTGGVPNPGSLTERAQQVEDRFTWLNHTYTHYEFGDTGNETAKATSEIVQNNALAAILGFTDYTTRTLLTGAYSGLANPTVIGAAYDQGVRYMLCNASDPNYDNPTPNTGIIYDLGDGKEMLLLPRNANDLFYAPTTPELETDLYNWVYCTTDHESCWDYSEVLDLITDPALGFLLDFSVNATMFHMNALEAYDYPTTTHTLLGDFVDKLYEKYNAIYTDTVPILSLRTQEIGERMWERMDYDASGVSGVIGCGNWITLTTPAAAPDLTRVPVTGIVYGDDHEFYAMQDISYVTMTPNLTVTITGADPVIPAAITGLGVAHPDEFQDVVGWTAVSQDTHGDPIDILAYRVYTGTTPSFTLDVAHSALTSDTIYTETHSSGVQLYYAVTAIGDNCWRHESDAVRSVPTVVTVMNLTATSDWSPALAPGQTLFGVGLVMFGLLSLRLVRRRPRRERHR